MEQLYKFGKKVKKGYDDEVNRNYEKDKWLGKLKRKKIIPFLSESDK